MRNRTYGGVRGRKMKVGGKLLHFPPTRFFLFFLVLFHGIACFKRFKGHLRRFTNKKRRKNNSCYIIILKFAPNSNKQKNLNHFTIFNLLT